MESRSNILVVDDNPDKLSLLEMTLRMAGYDVRTATDGEEALSAIESYPPDLVITDVMMPKMNGYELAERIRANPQTKFIPLILQTAAGHNAEDLRRGSEAGALGFITDLSDFDLLLARARTLLDFRAYLDTCEEEAFTDHLTGLANRRRFERQLEREVSRTLRYGRPICLLMLDIDNFKKLNDTFGHSAGDEAISRIGKVLREGTRGIDLAARIGGEEFALILTDATTESACRRAEKLREEITQLVVQHNGEVLGKISLSIGVSTFPEHASNAEQLLHTADKALYKAKREGRDRVVSSERG